MKIGRYIDHAVLNPGMARDEIDAAVRLGIALEVYSVCMHPRDVRRAAALCAGTNTRVISVVDFPHGAAGAAGKRALAKFALDEGAEELDLVMNYSAARSGDWAAVEEEIRAVVEEARAKDAAVKVIFETSELDEAMIRRAVEVSIAAGADFVKTSTGFASHGATEKAVSVMLDQAKGRIKVKPSGGIRDYETAKKYIEMGASRLGVGFGGSGAVITGEGKSPDSY